MSLTARLGFVMLAPMNQHPVPCVYCTRYLTTCHMCQDPDATSRWVAYLRAAYGWDLEGTWVTLPKPKSNGFSSGPVRFRPGSEGCLKDYENLVEFLSLSSWPDGSPRELGTLLIALGGNGWRLKVRDPNGQRYAFYAAASFEEALAGLDEGLGRDDLDWRPEKPFVKGK